MTLQDELIFGSFFVFTNRLAMRRATPVDLVNSVSAFTLLLLLPFVWGVLPHTMQIAMSNLIVGATFGAAYLVAFVVLLRRSESGSRILVHLIMVGMATIGAAFVGFVLFDWFFPNGKLLLTTRRLLAIEFFVGLMLVVMTVWLPGRKKITAAFLVAAIAVTALSQPILAERQVKNSKLAVRTVTHVDSSLYGLRVTHYSRWIPRSFAHGGALALLDGRVLVSDGDGNLYLVSESESKDSLDIEKFRFKVPINSGEFASESKKIFSHTANDTVEVQDFRVAALAVRELGGSIQIFASHHYWIVERQCYVLRVSMLQGRLTQLMSGDPGVAWKTVFDTSPCLPLDMEGTRGARFEGYENGGRMVFMSDEEILLSVGDQGSDGVNRSAALAQDAGNSYGKTLFVNVKTGQSRVFTIGHRNPQGLYAQPDGTVWLTEHGPRGGDELNLLAAGGNYGWPLVTYGTDYSKHEWPLNAAQGRHDNFQEPVFAFVPSVAVTSIIRSNSTAFPLWDEDYLVGSLKEQTLFRLKMREGRVVFSEPIALGQKIRDLLIQPDGRIVVLTPFQDLLFVEADDSVSGESLAAACAACHGINEQDRSGLGPNLWEVVGRPVGADRFFGYSESLRGLGGRWTHERLDAFLQAPQKFAPGTSMAFPGIESEADRKMLIGYLETLKRTE